MKSLREQFSYFLKDSVRLTINFALTDQNKGIRPPPVEKPFSADSKRIDLLPPDDFKNVTGCDLVGAIRNRKSHRQFTPKPLTIEELSFLLWATQGVREMAGEGSVYRTVPSAGCRHAIETYLCVINVEGLEEGIYRYLPVKNQLLLVSPGKNLADRITKATLNQSFIGKAPVVFIWAAIPYRMEWRYDVAAYKVIALDAGHVCQNLYLASSAIGAGTCAVAAYHQEMMDELIGVDGENEFAIYLAPVGKI